MRMVSPNELQDVAKDIMLGGREPVTREDWQLCANFWAKNIQAGLEESAVPLLGMILSCPLSKKELKDIAQFQASQKEKEEES